VAGGKVHTHAESVRITRKRKGAVREEATEKSLGDVVTHLLADQGDGEPRLPRDCEDKREELVQEGGVVLTSGVQKQTKKTTCCSPA